MKKFVYVQAYYIDNALSFRSTILRATDEDDAYHVGGRWSDKQPKVSLVNDYVVEV